MTAVRKPCASCPWRVDQTAATIPNFSLELAENLAATCPDDRGMGPECAGWLRVAGLAHPAVRLNAIAGAIRPEAFEPGGEWPELHGSFAEVIEKLRATA